MGTSRRVEGGLAADVVIPWRDDPVVTRTTEKIIALDRRTARTFVSGIVRIGAMLRTMRDRLPHGEFEEWLEEGVHIEPRTARRYIGVSEWATDRPDEFAKVQALSVTKLYRLLSVEPEVRRTLYDRRLAIPGTTKRLHLADMTVDHLERVLGDLAPAPPRTNPVPKLLKAARSRIAGLDATTTELIAHQRRVDDEAIAEIHAELMEVAERIEEAFGL